MLYIGDKIFYPSFGAGIISNIEEKEVYGSINKYYIITLTNGLTTMVPVKARKDKKIRKCIEKLECMSIVKNFRNLSIEIPEKWLDRSKFYTYTMKEGDIKKMSALYNTLHDVKEEKGISNTEEKVLEDIFEMISGEISIVLDTDIDKIKVALESEFEQEL